MNLDNTNVSGAQFLLRIGVGMSNHHYTSLAQSVAISRSEARATVRRPSGEIESWWTISKDSPVYKKIMYTNVI